MLSTVADSWRVDNHLVWTRRPADGVRLCKYGQRRHRRLRRSRVVGCCHHPQQPADGDAVNALANALFNGVVGEAVRLCSAIAVPVAPCSPERNSIAIRDADHQRRRPHGVVQWRGIRGRVVANSNGGSSKKSGKVAIHGVTGSVPPRAHSSTARLMPRWVADSEDG